MVCEAKVYILDEPIDGVCEDNLPHCGQWSSDGYCDNVWYKNYLMLHCLKSCKLCTQS